jgi:hypothetical protein
MVLSPVGTLKHAAEAHALLKSEGTVVISESEAHAYHPQRRVMTVLECS